MNKLYIASSLQNWIKARELMEFFRSHGITITYDWTPLAEAIYGEKQVIPTSEEHLRRAANNELKGVLDADHLLVLQPGRKGTYFEFGSYYTLHQTRGDLQNRITILDVDPALVPTSFDHLEFVEVVHDEESAKTRVLNCFKL